MEQEVVTHTRQRPGGSVLRLRIRDSVLENIDDWAGRHAMTRAEAVRYIIEIGLKAAHEEQPTER